jgi:ornithine carbamoyltransferase
MPRHFLDLNQIPPSDLRAIIDGAKRLKNAPVKEPLLSGKTLAMIFEKPSTRTRFSFDIVMQQLGGHAIVTNQNDMQLGRGEPIADTAKVLSRYVDIIMLRSTYHERLIALAEHATVPVINGLTDKSHPCQIMADILTIEEHRGTITAKKIAWIGDVNNVCVSFIHAAIAFDFTLHIACPVSLQTLALPYQDHKNIVLTIDITTAATGADVIVTDTWISMGCPDEAAQIQALTPYQVNSAVMNLAKSDVLFLHCLPAVRGQEVTPEVIDGAHSVVWDEAENRLHAQKAILLWCLGKL